MKTILNVLSCILIFGSGTATGFVVARIYRNQIVEPTKIIKVTAYCPCSICCGRWADGQTASGYWIQPGDRFVAAPKHIPFGTEMIVPGYNNDKPVEVKDRGGAITVERLDVYFDTHDEALKWGVKYLEIRIIKRR